MHNKICHLTSAHPRYDTRIFVKMCSSLANQGYETTLVVADGLGDEIKDNVKIVDVGVSSSNRISRMTKSVKQVYKQALWLDADIYHLHDPELIPIGLKLKGQGKIVIFDAHEDLPKQILGKSYLNPIFRNFLSKSLEIYERWACHKFDALIAATPYIRDKFLPINQNTVDVNNFPLLDELTNTTDWNDKQDEVVYLGGMAKIRGIEEIVLGMDYTKNIRLNLAGMFSEKDLEERVKLYPSWEKVNEVGFLNRHKVNKVLAKSKAGLVTLHPVINYIDALPVKMFEYMAAGIPVVASNFPLWRGIVEGSACGICIDPLDPKAIGEAVQYLVEHPYEAEQMGINGRKAVEEKYNWSIEVLKLLSLYDKLARKNDDTC